MNSKDGDSFQITNFISDYPLKIDVTINIVNNVLLFENLKNKFFYNRNRNKKQQLENIIINNHSKIFINYFKSIIKFINETKC